MEDGRGEENMDMKCGIKVLLYLISDQEGLKTVAYFLCGLLICLVEY